MTYNLVKLIGVFALVIVLIVAIGLDWIAADWGAVFIGTLIGYVVGNASVTGVSPIVSRSDQ